MKIGSVLGLLVALLAVSACGQTTQPANLSLSFRANQAYNQGDYAAALPLLQELAGALIDQPEKLGPVEEQIRVCKKAIAAAQKQRNDPAAIAAATAPSATRDARVPHPAPKTGEVLQMSIQDLGNFDYDADHGGNIPADVLRLNGATLRLRGYMIPLDQAENIGEFALVPSLSAIPFGRPRKVQQVVVVHLPPGQGINYSPDELQVQGTLSVKEKKDNGLIVSIFDLDATSVKAVPR